MRLGLSLLFFILCFFLTTFADEKTDMKLSNYFITVEFDVEKNHSVFVETDELDPYFAYYNNHIKVRLFGIIISEDMIAIPHLPLDPERIQNIKLTNHNGESFEGYLEGYDLERDIQTIRTGKKLAKLSWKYQTVKKLPKPIYETSLIFREYTPYVVTKEVSSEINLTPFLKNNINIYPNEESNNSYDLAIISNKNGEALGIQSRRYYRIQNKNSIFKPQEIKTISLKDLQSKYDEVQQKLHKQIFFVKMNFRDNGKEEEFDDISSPNKVHENSKEVKTFGILLNTKGDVLIPKYLPINKINDLESIEIHLKDKIIPAEFKGALTTIGGLIINSQEIINNTSNLSLNTPTEEELIYDVSLRWSSIDDYQLEVMVDRFAYRLYEYKQKKSSVLKNILVTENSLCLNKELKICGINTNYINPLVENNSLDKYNFFKNKIILLEDIKEEIINFENFFDKRAALLTRQDAATPNWLGVLTQTPSTSMLEYMKISDKTKNGTIGLLVTHVYKNSPAAKMGLMPLDVLVSITPEETKREIDFSKKLDAITSYNQNYENNFLQENLIPSIRNEVTNQLNKLEVGKNIILKYIRNSTLYTSTFILEKAPKDFITADKVVDDDFGIHVKDLTFEVRDVMHLKEEDPGIIISFVEQGKPIDIAQIHDMYIITKIDDEQILSVSQFKKIIEERKMKGQKQFSFTILFLGKTAMISVNLKS